MVVSKAPDEQPIFSLPGVPSPRSIQPDSSGVKRMRDAEMDVKVGLSGEAGPSHQGFGFSVQDLCDINQEHDAAALQKIGGVPAVCQGLEMDPTRGILGDEADTERRIAAFGSNTYPEKEGKSFLMYLWEATNDLTLRILAVCAVVSMAVGIVSHGAKEGWYDGVGIVIAVVLVVLLGAISNYRQALQFRSLNAEKRKVAVQVTRAGRRVRLTIFELLVGDVVHLNIGDQVPADGLFLEGHSLTVDESAMTGESDPMHKDVRRPFLISGCKVVDGFGTMVVTSVGMNTEWGKVMSTLNEENDGETPLQERLGGVAKFMSKVGLTVAFFVFVVLVARYFADRDNFRTDRRTGEKRETIDHVKAIIDYFAIFVTIVVVAIPEGLPLAVTLALAYSMRKMMADKALVRHLAACETMGSATTICSDKTGTLTLNQMTVVQAWVAGRLGDIAAVKPVTGQAVVEAPPAAVQALLWEAVGLNTNSSVYQPEGGGDVEVAGSPTEAAVLTWGLKLGLNFERLRARYEIVHVEAFNSAKKRMGVLVRAKEGAKELNLHWKGAAEIVLGQCTHVTDDNGAVTEMSDSTREELLQVIQGMAVASLRTLCLAYRPASEAEAPSPGAEEEGSDKYELPESGLICLAIVGIKDPPRPEVPEAMRMCREAGVTVRMVTGDNLVTAKAIATEVGILTPGGLAMEGREFRALSDADRVRVLKNLQVLARSSPTDKHLLVKTLRSMNHVVGVTGDGTNDAPALKEADIGLAMGIAGTEVAKESADIVILDDNFSSIVKVIKWGRSVYANIQKFLQFQLTINCVALLINLISAIAVGDSPLTVVQMLWVNLMADSLAALALATEPPTDDLLKRKPVGRSDAIITPIMWRNIIGMSAYQLTVLLLVQFVGHRFLPGIPRSKSHQTPVQDSKYADKLDVELVTIIFNSFVMCQIFNEVNARKPNEINVLSGLFGNWIFISVLVLTAALQFLLVTFAGDFASTKALDGQQWAVCIVIGAIGMPVAALIKLIPVPEDLFTRAKKKEDYEIDSTPPVIVDGVSVIRS